MTRETMAANYRPSPKGTMSWGLGLLWLSIAPGLLAATPLAPPPQDQGLPYTRSADSLALEKIRTGVAVFAGSRYGYVRGLRVRIDPANVLDGEAVAVGGKTFVPAAFAALIGRNDVQAPPLPADLAPLADRWVHEPGDLTGGKDTAASFRAPAGVETREIHGATWFAVEDLAKAKGLPVTRHPRGLVFAGKDLLGFGNAGESLLDPVIALFDTPDKYADPDIATRAIPALARQGKWTDHVKVTPEQLAVLNGPATRWPTAPAESFDFAGFRKDLLGSEVPPPGVYPRLLCSPQDVPRLAARAKSTRVGQMALAEMGYLFRKTWWDESKDDGRLFAKLAGGDLTGLEWDAPQGAAPHAVPHSFKGFKQGIFSSHIAYVPECLTSMALWCLIEDDAALGRKVAAAFTNYYRLREPLIDQWLMLSDSEFGSSMLGPDGQLVEINGAGSRTHWRGMHGLVAHMNLGIGLDLAGKWMDAEQKDTMRRVIAKATYGRRSYGQDAPTRFRDVNWMAWDLPHFLAVAAIEGLPGFDREAYAAGAESVRAFCDWGVSPAGTVYESNGKSPGSFQFQLLSMVALARRGDNLFGHPHWRKLLEAQVQMTSPNGRATVNSGTQYAPFSRQPLSLHLLNQIKAFYPKSKQADYLLDNALSRPGAADDEGLREWPREGFDPQSFATVLDGRKRIRLPGLTYPGFVHGVWFSDDTGPATRADLALPLDFADPVHGVFSAYSDRSADAVWINMMVRPDHYLGAGHHHADAGMLHFSASGIDWFTESRFPQEYGGNFHNLLRIDGESQASNIPGQVNGYNAAAKWLGASTADESSQAAADLTDAYSWRWLTQPPQEWSDGLRKMDWEMEPSARIAEIFAGTARMKMRPWWPTATFSNYIATSRAPFQPMRHVFRTVALARGARPHAVVIDDACKDDRQRLYQWVVNLGEGVCEAKPGVPTDGSIVLAWRPAVAGVLPEMKPVSPSPGEPLLLVRPLVLGEAVDGMVAPRLERIDGPPDRNGKVLQDDRLRIDCRGKRVSFRVCLVPFRAGESLPLIQADAAGAVVKVSGPGGSQDEWHFTAGKEGRTRCILVRDGKPRNSPVAASR